MSDSHELNNKSKLSLQDFTKKSTFAPTSAKSLRSMNDGLHYTMLKEGVIEKYSYETGQLVSTIFDINEVDQSQLTHKIENVKDYFFNYNETFLLIIPYKQMIYRRSFTTIYCLYEISTKKLINLPAKQVQKIAKFSPDGKNLSYVQKNNLYIYNIDNKTEKQITTDGEMNHILNGESDWVYEEEFAITRAYEWSPDGQSIAYIKFDESKVPVYNIQKYKGSYPTHTQNEIYPENYKYKYPKAGENNSIVSLHVYDLDKETTITIKIDEETDIYVPRIKFTKNPKILLIFHLNRHQNCLTIFSSNIISGEIHVVYRERNKYYIDSKFLNQFNIFDNGKDCAIESETSGYNHIYSFTIDESNYDLSDEEYFNRRKAITSGNFDVKDFIGYDETRNLYYYSSYEVSSIELYIYCIDNNGNKMNISLKKSWNEAKHSKNYNYFIIENSSSDTVPTTILYRNDLTINNNKICGQLTEIKVLKNNALLQKRINIIEYIPKKEFFTTLASDCKTELNMCILKPKLMIEMENKKEKPDPQKKFPLLITLYGGPNSQYVKNKFHICWKSYLVQEGFIVASIDPRGTAAHGEAFRKCTYLKLGQIESNDVIYATTNLIKKYDNFIDKNRVGIWGWSYGGFLSLLCLSNGNDVFSTSIAVAPVTNWKYYDTIYTERYMRTPQENQEGYEYGAPLHIVNKISPKAHLLICHGLCDDNVHYQNTAEYTEELVQNNIQFDIHVYTNRNHSIYGGNTKNHLYSKIVNFLKQYMLHHDE